MSGEGEIDAEPLARIDEAYEYAGWGCEGCGGVLKTLNHFNFGSGRML